ncbi:MAG: Uma2 family endonuclease [Chloroflexota bacterium]|nr:Uma2 family endonuclease [Chloroflexota bacterium]MDE2909884.1 Uma2 family endonuclease [Chloroflexota bacterium]
MAIERVKSFPLPHKFTVEEYLAFEERSEFKHEFIDGVIYDWGDPDPDDPVHPDYVPGYPMPHLFTVEEYLAFENESELKHEFIDGIIYDMTGGTFNHSRIKVRMTFALELQLIGSNYTVCNSDMRVEISGGRHVYPDVSVVYGAAQLKDDETTLLNPILAVEVLSPTTANYDRSTKLMYYQSLPSLRGCLIVEQYGVQIDAYTRADSGWRHRSYSSMDDVIPLEMIGCELPLAEVYRGIVFSEE